MTLPNDRATPAFSSAFLIPASILLGCLALAARPAGTMGGFAVALGVGLIGAIAPLSHAPLPRAREAEVAAGGARWLAVAAFGTGAFMMARVLAHPLVPPARPVAIAGVIAVAVAEELFFRRLAYGWLARWGTAVAVIGAAILFALVHIPTYGAAVLPLDFAAGLLFGWQRWTTGTWTASAFTHAAANVLQLL